MTGPDPDEVLGDLATRLQALAEEATLRGAGRARFLYVTRGKRAVEASIDEAGAVWVEYWLDSTDEHAAPVKDATFASVDAAQASIGSWLAEESCLK